MIKGDKINTTNIAKAVSPAESQGLELKENVLGFEYKESPFWKISMEDIISWRLGTNHRHMKISSFLVWREERHRKILIENFLYLSKKDDTKQ